MKNIAIVALGLLIGIQSFAQTKVEGTISTATKWTKANSPYIISGNVVLIDELVIEPGVAVTFSGNFELRVAITGKLVAEGTITDSIHFKSDNNITWNRIFLDATVDSSKFSYVNITNANKGLDAQESYVNIKNSRFTNCINGMFLDDCSGNIDSCRIEKCDYGVNIEGNHDEFIISNSKVLNNEYGIYNNKFDLFVSNCLISNNSEFGFYTDRTSTISNCIIENNEIGVFAEFSYHKILKNDIEGNKIGVQLGRYPFRTSVHCNSFATNSEYDLFFDDEDWDGTIDATNNYFGTQNKIEIDKRIFDIYDNSKLNVWFKIEPFLRKKSDLKITTQSGHQQLKKGDTLKLFVVASEPDATFQWQKDGINLKDSTRIFGATSDTLIIINTENVDTGLYTCIVSTFCKQLQSTGSKFTLDNSSVINKNLNNSSTFNVYPNPAHDYLNFKSSKTSGTYSIFDIYGNILNSGVILTDQNTISVAHLATGVYFIKIDDVMLRFVKVQ